MMNSTSAWIRLTIQSLVLIIVATIHQPAQSQITATPQAEISPLAETPVQSHAAAVVDNKTLPNLNRSIAAEKTTSHRGSQHLRVAAILDGPPSQSPPSKKITPPPKRPNVLAIDDDVMAEIKEIRRQLGGGIGESLKGLADMPAIGDIKGSGGSAGDAIKIAPDDSGIDLIQDAPDPAEAIFDEQLRNVVTAGTLPATDETNQDQDHNQNQNHRSNGNEKKQPDLPNPIAGGLEMSDRWSTKTGSAKIVELRKCAREIEELAGRLESVASYEVADRLRAQAAILWGKARSNP